jgi:Protein of unknown function (DUF3048) N-terminal domain/Protein of unknown function (DUF3048) C-terminal domain
MTKRLRSDRRVVSVAIVLLIGVLGGVGFLLVSGPGRSPATVAAVQPSSPTASGSITPSAAATGGPSAIPSASPLPSPSGPPAIYEDLSGIPSTAELAHRYPIAVMIDDSPAARQQAGLSSASMVWQAPAEGGIPRYMAIFQSGTPPRIGPIRSARLYFVRWAAEWKAVYLHAGGPPPLRAFLAGRQTLVLDVPGRATRRVTFRAAPHNLYTEGVRLRHFVERAKRATSARIAYNPTEPGRLQAFRDAASEADRGPDRGSIRVTYTSEVVSYRYDRASNTWLRSVDGRDQHDALATANRGNGTIGSGARIAPTTVVVMVVPIRRSKTIEGPALGRLEADSLGTNTAWVFADGRVTKGTWHKRTPTDRTRFLDAAGHEIAFPRGQIFIQVVPKTSAATFSVEAAR